MKAGLSRLGTFIRRSIVRLIFFFSMMIALQLAQLHETARQLERFQAEEAIAPISPATVSVAEVEITPSSDSTEDKSEDVIPAVSQDPAIIITSNKNSCSLSYDSFENYFLTWKELASLSYWGLPVSFLRETSLSTLERSMGYFYPAIALTPLAFVYLVYGYVLPFVLLMILRFLSIFIFKRKNNSPEKIEE